MGGELESPQEKGLKSGAYWTPPTSRLFGGWHTNARLSGVVWSGITIWDWLIGPIWGCQVGYHDLGLTGRASESATSRSGVGIWGWHVSGHKTLEKTVLTKFFFFNMGAAMFFLLSQIWLVGTKLRTVFIGFHINLGQGCCKSVLILSQSLQFLTAVSIRAWKNTMITGFTFTHLDNRGCINVSFCLWSGEWKRIDEVSCFITIRPTCYIVTKLPSH